MEYLFKFEMALVVWIDGHFELAAAIDDQTIGVRKTRPMFSHRSCFLSIAHILMFVRMDAHANKKGVNLEILCQ